MGNKKTPFALLCLALWLPLSGQTRAKPVEVRGSVTDEAGIAIRGAHIFVHRNVDPWGDKVEFAGQSGADGDFVLKLPAGAYDIFVTADSRSAQAQTVLVKTGSHLDLHWKLLMARDVCDFPEMNCDHVEEELHLPLLSKP